MTGAARPRLRAAALAAVATLALGGASARAAAAPGAAVRRFALVIGNNAPPRADLARLRYADDDAVRWAVLFATLGTTVEVLTELDAESQRLYGGAVPPLGPPSRAGLSAAVGRISAEIAKARARGDRTVFYFVYAGHGDVERGQGSISLADAWLSRDELGAAVLAPAAADVSHVIVDACRASYLLGNRGPGGERRPWSDAYFRPGEARFPHTGFLLSSSSSGLSHEWEEFQAGIFSHEVRSGLLGPADANGDGRITYRELVGFVRLANRPVRNEKFRPQIVSRPPAGGEDTLLDLRDAGAGTLTLGAGPASHQMLEDRAGVRWADFHPSGAAPVRVLLPGASWNGPGFYLRALPDGAEYAVPAGHDVALADLAPQAPSLVRRGAIHDAFTHLFEIPFDEAALDHLPFELEPRDDGGADAPSGLELLRRRPAVRRAAVGATAAGMASLAVAAGLTISAVGLRDSADGKNGQQRVKINEEIDTRNRWAAITGIGGGVLTALGLGLLVWTRQPAE
jgi:hypothetical protein